MAIRVRLEKPAQPFTNVAQAVTDAMTGAMRETQLLVMNRARTRAPVGGTGALRRSITADEPVITAKGVQGSVGAGGSGAPYAKAVEFGTGVYSEAPDSTRQPIVIVPIHAKALAWPRGGMAVRGSGALTTGVRRKLASGKLTAGQAFVFARRVVQQGQRPRPFLRPALEESEADMLTIIGRWLDRMLP